MAGPLIALMLIRPLCIVAAQVGVAIFLGSWSATFPWWPFQMIAANIVCAVLLFALSSRGEVPLRRIYLHPFVEGSATGKLGEFLKPKRFKHRALALVRDGALFVGLLLALGLPAIAAGRLVAEHLPVAIESSKYAALPTWALLSVTLLLPLTMPLVEVPWYFGYFFPRLEEALGASSRRPAVIAGAIVTATYSLQHCLQPLALDAAFLALRSVMLLPVLALTALIIRLVPRFTPYILLLHAAMAIEVVTKYWAAS